MPHPSPRLILASRSLRREQLLRQAGYRFEVITPEVNEAVGACSNCGPAELVATLAMEKAGDVARRCDPAAGPAIVIGCDTVVECQGQILGKPHDEQHAREILRLLSGRRHRVYSGVCVWPVPAGEAEVEVEITTLTMDKLTQAQLQEYLESGLWRGKAGAFGYQDRHGWVHLLQGSESNVVGLPMELLSQMLKRHGVPPSARGNPA